MSGVRSLAAGDHDVSGGEEGCGGVLDGVQGQGEGALRVMECCNPVSEGCVKVC